MRESQTPVAIAGMGMVASLGLDAATCCAAARAGILRSRPLPFAFNDVRAKKVEHAVGHQVPFLTEGFEGTARLVRLLAGALQDLEASMGSPLPPRSGCYLSLPSRFRHVTGAEIVANEEVRKEMERSAAQSGLERPMDDAARILQQAGELLRFPVPALRFVTTVGHTGAAEAISAAIKDLRSGAVKAAVVGGVDSLLEEDSLVWLQVTARLKSSAVPAGLMPGEAAAVLLLTAAQAQRHGAHIGGACLRRDKSSFLRGDPPLGTALAEVARDAVGHYEPGDAPVWIVADLNGEPYRATDWGSALVRAQRALGDPVLWCPAASFGDTGAAGGAIGVCLAVRALDRGYAPARWSMVLSAADGPDRASLCVAAGGAAAVQ